MRNFRVNKVQRGTLHIGHKYDDSVGRGFHTVTVGEN